MMVHSPEINELTAALCAAQGSFAAIPKGSVNPFFKSKYASLPDVVKVTTPVLAAHDLAITQLLGHDDHGDTLTTVLLHASGQYIADTMHLRPLKNDPQAQGSAITYGRRYAYMAILGLVADEDDDGNAGSSPAKPSAADPIPETVTKKRAADLADIAFGLGVQDKLALAATHVHGTQVGDCSNKTTATESLRVLTVEQADKLDRWLSNKADEKAAQVEA